MKRNDQPTTVCRCRSAIRWDTACSRHPESVMALFVIVILLISLGPIIWVLLSSFKTNTEILNSAVNLPSVWSFKNYASALTIAPIGTFYLNSVIVAGTATVLNVFVLSMSSYVLARFRFRGRTKLRGLFGLALLIPAAALLQPLFLTMKTLGFYDTLLGLILCYAAFSLPVSMYILTSYYLTVPMEMEEAANIDGASFYRTFWQIILRLRSPRWRRRACWRSSAPGMNSRSPWC
jgi:raffinose/stachyose/melibiose transport system permease protein